MSGSINELDPRRGCELPVESPAAIGSVTMAFNELSVNSHPLKQQNCRRLVFAMLDSTLDVALLAQALQAVIQANGVLHSIRSTLHAILTLLSCLLML
jgi:hypothetical protein